MKLKKQKKKNYLDCIFKLFSILIILLIGLNLIFHQDSETVKIVGMIGGNVFLIWLMLKSNNWV